ncbi:MAG: type II toxin-antitoxin system prevent-host-death family antitoxin [Bifidobacteriaceae bacterium]|nr:type II toxin-antitoxin system prevent-host-death family antitoxin [Bifidobacteriaceae bacterium]
MAGVFDTVTAAEFNRAPSDVKRRALTRPVRVTERGRPSVVVMSYADYRRLSGLPDDLAAWLELPDDAGPAAEAEIEPAQIALEAAEL